MMWWIAEKLIHTQNTLVCRQRQTYTLNFPNKNIRGTSTFESQTTDQTIYVNAKCEAEMRGDGEVVSWIKRLILYGFSLNLLVCVWQKMNSCCWASSSLSSLRARRDASTGIELTWSPIIIYINANRLHLTTGISKNVKRRQATENSQLATIVHFTDNKLQPICFVSHLHCSARCIKYRQYKVATVWWAPCTCATRSIFNFCLASSIAALQLVLTGNRLFCLCSQVCTWSHLFAVKSEDGASVARQSTRNCWAKFRIESTTCMLGTPSLVKLNAFFGDDLHVCLTHSNASAFIQQMGIIVIGNHEQNDFETSSTRMFALLQLLRS